MCDTPPPRRKLNENEIPLASSFPVINDLTPRARRRAALEEKCEAKKRLNESRANAAAMKRAKLNNRHSKENMPVNVNKPRSLSKSLSKQSKGSSSQNSSPTDSASSQMQIDSLIQEFETKEAKFTSQIQKLNENNETLNQKVNKLQEEIESMLGEKAKLDERIAAADTKIEELDREVLKYKVTNKDLRNQVLELKGNIRVFARVRPALGKNEIQGQQRIFSFPMNDPEKQAISLVNEGREAVDGSKKENQLWDFKFDKVFHEYDTQEHVFDEIRHLVQSALDGYNVCVFAYGQTGSGKTFTMEGDANEKRGVIPRSVEQIFEAMSSNKKDGWTFQLKVSILEIYNETIRDLISDNSEALGGEIRHANGETTVVGASEIPVESPEKLYELITKAQKGRKVSATACNERSSRSHCVFSLKIIGHHAASEESIRGCLHLVDLAGSERLSITGTNDQQQLKETQAINKSLSCLGDVIFALGNGNKHVPFRNSKLTYMLQNSLGGNSKTLMFVNLSPASVKESLCSLRFASKVNSCQIGTARTSKANNSK